VILFMIAAATALGVFAVVGLAYGRPAGAFLNWRRRGRSQEKTRRKSIDKR
jgi:hypothetical protein